MRRAVVLGVIAAAVRIARADADAGAPDDLVGRAIVLAPAQVDARVVVGANLTQNESGRPLSIAPDVWAGITPRLTVGLVHDNPSLDRFEPGSTFCERTLTTQIGETNCTNAYHGSTLDVLFRTIDGPLSVAARMRLELRDVDPVVKPAATFGALVHWHHGRFAITGDPYVEVGLANLARGNEDQLFFPLRFELQPTRRWLLGLLTGPNGPIEGFTQDFDVPIFLESIVRATDHLDVTAMAGFPQAWGPQNTSRFRAVFVGLGWRT